MKTSNRTAAALIGATLAVAYVPANAQVSQCAIQPAQASVLQGKYAACFRNETTSLACLMGEGEGINCALVRNAFSPRGARGGCINYDVTKTREVLS